MVHNFFFYLFFCHGSNFWAYFLSVSLLINMFHFSESLDFREKSSLRFTAGSSWHAASRCEFIYWIYLTYFCCGPELSDWRCTSGHVALIKKHRRVRTAYFNTQHCFTFPPLPSFIFPGVVYPAVSPPIVPAVRGLVFFSPHNVHADCSTPSNKYLFRAKVCCN